MSLPDNFLSSLLFGILGGLLVLLVQQLAFPKQTVAVVDLQGIIVEQLDQAAKASGTLSETEIQSKAENFARRLDQEVNNLAKEYNALLLVSPAVIKGAPDLTAELRRRIQGVSTSEGNEQ